jgi:hypothetical protein
VVSLCTLEINSVRSPAHRHRGGRRGKSKPGWVIRAPSPRSHRGTRSLLRPPDGNRANRMDCTSLSKDRVNRVTVGGCGYANFCNFPEPGLCP